MFKSTLRSSISGAIRKFSFGGQTSRKMSTVQKSNVDYIGAGVFLTVCAGACYLGAWQVERYYWKVDLIEKEKLSLAQHTTVLTANCNQQEFSDLSNGLIGTRVRIQGEFIHSGEILMGPRAGHRGIIGAGAQGMGTNPQV